jgi:hypothetical protein
MVVIVWPLLALQVRDPGTTAEVAILTDFGMAFVAMGHGVIHDQTTFSLFHQRFFIEIN